MGAFAAEPLAIGDRRELFVDDFLVEKMENTRLAIGRPRYEGEVLQFDEPWEKAHGTTYVTVLKDNNVYRMYYRGTVLKPDGKPILSACYAESSDGIHWTKPNLGLVPFEGNSNNNIVIGHDERGIAQNFSVFLDDRPGVNPAERLKAVGGEPFRGLHLFGSADGVRWNLLSPDVRFKDYPLDSQNVALWQPSEQVYAIYLRTFTGGRRAETRDVHGLRTVSRSVSKDFRTWSEPVPMSFGDTPIEELYTNGTTPYFRAPHILISLAGRFWPDRRVLTDAEMEVIGVRANQRQGISDAVFMTSRGGNRYDRTFMESFIRPGLDHKDWTARNNYPALGIVPTGENEISIYTATHYAMPGNRLVRYSLRPDGFGSMHADYREGQFTTRELVFEGSRLELNFSTSAAGSIRVEFLDTAGQVIPGFSPAVGDEIIGDELVRAVRWGGKEDVSALSGKPVRIRFRMKDADLYSIKFVKGPGQN